MPGKNNKRVHSEEESQPREIPTSSKEQQRVNREAYREAEKDIETDPDLSAGSPNDDLDEGESARLGEDKTDLV